MADTTLTSIGVLHQAPAASTDGQVDEARYALLHRMATSRDVVAAAHALIARIELEEQRSRTGIAGASSDDA